MQEAAPVVHRSAPRRPHAVVIGSGFGGLAAAIRLGARGYRVTVLERLDGPGGRAYVHRRDGYTFDAGPTIVTAPFLFDELWSLCGKRFADDVELKAMDPFYRIRFHDGSHIDCYADSERMRQEVARLSAGDLAGYDRFNRLSAQIYKVGFEELGHVPFSSILDMAKVAPDMVRLGSHRSIYSVAASHVRDERLRFALSFHPLFVGGNPFEVTSIYGLITHLERKFGVHWAMGGTGRIVDAMVRLIEGQGNEVRFHADVSEITLKGRRATGVKLASGEEIPADVVVSNGDTAWIYRNLLPGLARKRWTDRRLDRVRYSMSLFVWYFGTRRRYDDVPHHTIMVGPRYRELVQDIFKRKVLSDNFSLYLHRPSATDPSVAPPGCDAYYVLSPVPHLESGVDWEERAEPYRKAVASLLAETTLPGFESEIATSLITTPRDFQDRLLSYRGAAFGFEPVLLQSAWFRPHNLSDEVERLYLVGSSTHPGAGVPGVISSARVLDRIVPDVDALT